MPLPSNQNSLALASAQLLQLVLDTIPQKVFWKDLDSIYLGCNQLFAAVAGLSAPDEIVGLTDFDLAWTEDEAKFYRTCDRRVMERNEPEVGIIESQTNMNGELTWLQTSKVPLLDTDGKVIGILGSFHDITMIKEAEQTLQRSYDQLEKRVQDRTKKLRHVAEHDSLTNLVNRNCFLRQLDEVVVERERFALLFVDLDRFKTINDSLGHGVGDQLLIQVGSILKWAVREADTVGRFGGDEFTVLLRGVRSEDEVLKASERIQDALGKSIVVDGSPLVVSASIGFVVDLTGKYKSASDVLRDSDIAMYEAKEAARLVIVCSTTICCEKLARN